MASNERLNDPSSGYMMLFLFLILFVGSIVGLIMLRMPVLVVGLVISIIMLPGFVLVNPNGSRVLLLFGKYMGTIKKNGLFWVNPLYTKKRISLRARNFDS